MATPYQKVYDRFLGKIKDYEFGELSDVVMEYDMHSLMESSIPFFIYPKVNLSMNEEKQEFEGDLSLEEINILASLMRRELFKRNAFDTDVTRQKFGESDFTFKSQASHLNALCNAEVNILDKEIKKLLYNYSRAGRGQMFNYKKLAGR